MGQINDYNNSNILDCSFKNKKTNNKNKVLNCVNDYFWDEQVTIDNNENYEPSDEEIIACEKFDDDDEPWEIDYDQNDTQELMLNFKNNENNEW